MKTRILQTGPILKNNSGFSFLEIIVVLAIMSLMMALVVPSFNRMFASVEGVREGEKVLHLFQKARAEAILKAEPTNITFYPDGQCVFQFKGKVMEYQDKHFSILLNKADDESDPETSAEDEEEKIVQTFNPDGTANLSRLDFQTKEGTYVIYTFNPVNGKIEMERSQTL